MTTPISATHASHAQQTQQSSRPTQAAPQTQKATLPQDTVNLKSTGNSAGDADRDGDSK
jgi:hypothetical protein